MTTFLASPSTANDMVNEWFKSNSWSIVVLIASIVASYAINGYRIGEVERDVEALRSKLDTVSSIAVDVAVLKERSTNQSSTIDDINTKLDTILKAFKIPQ